MEKNYLHFSHVQQFLAAQFFILVLRTDQKFSNEPLIFVLVDIDVLIVLVVLRNHFSHNTKIQQVLVVSHFEVFKFPKNIFKLGTPFAFIPVLS